MASSSKSKVDNANNKGSKHLSRGDYSLLLDWLELGDNKDRLDDVEKKTKVGVRPVVRSKAYAEMAEYLNQNQKKGSQLEVVTGKSMKNRWRHLLIKYRETKALENSTDFGLTEKDVADGLKSVAEKLEKECLCYGRLDALYGASPATDPVGWNAYQSRGKVPPRSESDKENAQGEAWMDDADPKLAQATFEEQLATGQVSESPLSSENEDGDEEDLEEGDLGLNANVIPDSIPSSVPDSIPVSDDDVQMASADVPSPDVTVADVDAFQFVGETPGGNAPSGGNTRPVRGRKSAPQRSSPNVDSEHEIGGVETDRERSEPEWGVRRSRSQTMSKDKSYPNKKQISENRHSINSAFASNLDVVNEQRERANQLRAEKMEDDRRKQHEKMIMQTTQREEQRALDEKKLVWERERFQQELEANRTQQKESNSLQIKLALIAAMASSNKSIDEVKALLELVKE